MKKNFRIIFMLITMLIILFMISIFNSDKRPKIPYCTGNLKLSINNKAGEVGINYLINIIPNENNREVLVLLSGRAKIKNEQFVIARRYTFSYEINEEYINLTASKVYKDPADNINLDSINGIPIKGQKYTLLITKLSNSRYIFEENEAPWFLCLDNRKLNY